MSGCLCQHYGKSGVPHVRSWRCLVCGRVVDPAQPFVCPAYQLAGGGGSEATGPCTTCGQLRAAHSFAAQALGEGLPPGVTEDRCGLCGALIGIRAPTTHHGVCAACTATATARGTA